MPKPIIPAEPVHGYKLTFWTTGFNEVVERTWTYYLHATPCVEVLGEGHENGAPFENDWYTGGGRFQGWALPDFKIRGYHDMWADSFPTRLEALRHFQQQLKNRRESEQRALEKTRGLLERVERELGGVLDKRDRRALRRAAAGKSKPGTVPAHRVEKLGDALKYPEKP